MRKHNNFELLLHAAAEEYMEKRAEEFSELDTSEVADQIRMRDRARKLMVRSKTLSHKGAENCGGCLPCCPHPGNHGMPLYFGDP